MKFAEPSDVKYAKDADGNDLGEKTQYDKRDDKKVGDSFSIFPNGRAGRYIDLLWRSASEWSLFHKQLWEAFLPHRGVIIHTLNHLTPVRVRPIGPF